MKTLYYPDAPFHERTLFSCTFILTYYSECARNVCRFNWSFLLFVLAILPIRLQQQHQQPLQCEAFWDGLVRVCWQISWGVSLERWRWKELPFSHTTTKITLVSQPGNISHGINLHFSLEPQGVLLQAAALSSVDGNSLIIWLIFSCSKFHTWAKGKGSIWCTEQQHVSDINTFSSTLSLLFSHKYTCN